VVTGGEYLVRVWKSAQPVVELGDFFYTSDHGRIFCVDQDVARRDFDLIVAGVCVANADDTHEQSDSTLWREVGFVAFSLLSPGREAATFRVKTGRREQ
jgi:hypothetical protein